MAKHYLLKIYLLKIQIDSFYFDWFNSLKLMYNSRKKIGIEYGIKGVNLRKYQIIIKKNLIRNKKKIEGSKL